MRSETKSLYDLATWKNGLAFRQIHFSETGRPIIKIAELKNGITAQTQFTNETFSDEVALHYGDMVFSWSGNPETSIDVFLYDLPDGWLNQHIFKVTAAEGVYKKYLYYVLKSLKPRFTAIASNKQTTGLGHVTVKDLKEITVELPPYADQITIGDYLSTIDEKANTNRAINDNLQQQVDLLIKIWLQNLVPFGGDYPDTWKTVYLSEIADFISGYSYKGTELKPSSTAMATIKNFDRNGGFKLDGFKEIVPSNKIKPDHYVDKFDILVAHTDLTQKADVIGNAEMVMSFSDYEKIIFSMDLVKVVPKSPQISRFLLAGILHSAHFKSHCLGYVNGTTVLHLSKKALPEYELKIPADLCELQPLTDALEVIYTQIAQNISENRRLEDLRDSLLPKLMSGEIDVSDVQF